MSHHDGVHYGAPVYWNQPCADGEPCSSCGIYAFRTYDDLRSYRSKIHSQEQAVRECYGIIAAWGKIVVCEKGFRAGYAYPLALLDWTVYPHHLPDGILWHHRLHRVARQYGIPVAATRKELVQIAREAGAVSVKESGG